MTKVILGGPEAGSRCEGTEGRNRRRDYCYSSFLLDAFVDVTFLLFSLSLVISLLE